MALLDVFIVALIPVLETLLVAAVGVFLASARVNILNLSARHNLNNLVFFVFNPAYIASSLVDSISMSSLVELWFIPVNVLLTFIIGSTLGWILVKITKTPQHLHGLVIACCAAGNLGNLPIIIIPAVCKERNSPFGDSVSCSTQGQAYASLPMAIAAAFMWSYAYNRIRADAMLCVDSTDTCSLEETLLPKENSITLQNDDKTEVPFPKRIKQQLKPWLAKLNLEKVFTPTTIATIVGLFIGAISSLRSLVVGDSAPLRVIDNSASMLGQAAIPAMTLILGANLLEGLNKSGVGVRIIVGVQAVRFVAMPILGIFVVKGAHHVGLLGSDSLYHFVLMMHYAVPSAMAIGTMTQLVGVGENDCSAILMWTYVVASLAVTLCLFGLLSICGFCLSNADAYLHPHLF